VLGVSQSYEGMSKTIGNDNLVIDVGKDFF
jgi:hypothetical protein